MSFSPDTIQASLETAPAAVDPAAMPEGFEQQAPPQDEFRYKLPTGSVYRDEADLVNGAIEKDITIERLKNENLRLKTQPIRQQPVVPPAPQDGLDDISRELFREMKAEFPDRDEADLKSWAKAQGRVLGRITKSIEHGRTSERLEAEYNSIRAKDTSFDINSGLGAEIFDANPGLTPKQHYALYRLELADRGGNPTAATTAAANLYTRGFTNAGGSAATSPQAAGANHPHVENAVKFAISRGVKDPVKLEDVRQRAIADLPNVISARKG